MANVLILSSAENATMYCDFVVIGLNEDMINSLNDYEEFKAYIEKKLKDNNIQFDSYGQIYVGDLLLFREYNSIVEVLPKKGIFQRQYRDYTRKRDVQLVSTSSIIIAEDSRTSWNTVRTALGARTVKVPCYGVVLEVIRKKTNKQINRDYDNKNSISL